MEWACSAVLTAPATRPGAPPSLDSNGSSSAQPGAPHAPAAVVHPGPVCGASHSSQPWLALGSGGSLRVWDVFTRSAVLHTQLPSPAVCLTFTAAYPTLGVPATVCVVLDSGHLVAVDCTTGSLLAGLALCQPPKGLGLGRPPLVALLPGLPRPVLAYTSPGRSALFALDLAAGLAHLPSSAPSPPKAAALVAAAAAAKLRTEYKKPITCLAAHPEAPVLYVAYATGFVRGYEVAVSATGVSVALRGSFRTDKADAGAVPAARGGASDAVPTITALTVLPQGGPDGRTHLLVAGDAAGKLSCWTVHHVTGAMTPFAACAATPPGSAPVQVRGLVPVRGAASVLAHTAPRTQHADAASAEAPPCRLACFSAFPVGGASGSGCVGPSAMLPSDADMYAAVDAACAQRPHAVPPAVGAALRTCGVADILLLPGTATTLALLVPSMPSGSPPSSSSGCHVVLLQATEAALEATCVPCMLASPAHVPCTSLLAPASAAHSNVATTGVAPPKSVYPSQLYHWAGGSTLAALDVATDTAASVDTILMPSGFGPAASACCVTRSDEGQCCLVFVRPRPGAAPTQYTVVADAQRSAGRGMPGSAAFRPGRCAAFCGPGDSHAAVVDVDGTALEVYATSQLEHGAPLTHVQLPRAIHRVFRDAPEEGSAAGGDTSGPSYRLLYSVDGLHLGRINLGVAITARAQAASLRSRLRLGHDEAVLQVAWQVLPHSSTAAGSQLRPRAVAAVLTTTRVFLADRSLTRVLASFSPEAGLPPRSLLWVGPALLFSTLTAIWHLDWHGDTHLVASLDPAEACASGSEHTRQPGSPRDSFSSAAPGGDPAGLGFGPDPMGGPPGGATHATMDDAPVLLGACNDRLLVAFPQATSAGCAPTLLPRVRACGLGETMLRGWVTLHSVMPFPSLAALHATLAVTASAADGARLSPALVPLLATVGASGLAAALLRAPGAALGPSSAAAVNLHCGDLAAAAGALRRSAATSGCLRSAAAAAGTHLGLPPRDDDMAQAQVSAVGLALSGGDFGTAWDLALLTGDVTIVLAVLHACLHGGGDTRSLDARLQRVQDSGLRHAVMAARGDDPEVAAVAARLTASAAAAVTAVAGPPGTQPQTQGVWNVRTAPGNGAIQGVRPPKGTPALLPWRDPRQGGAAAAVTGATVKAAAGMDGSTTRRVTPVAPLPRDSAGTPTSVAGGGGNIFGSAFPSHGGGGSPHGGSYRYGGGGQEGSVRPSAAELSRPPSAASSLGHAGGGSAFGGDDAVPTSHLFAHSPRASGAHVASSGDGGGGGTSSDDEFGSHYDAHGTPGFGGPTAGRPRFVVNIRSDAALPPALPARPLPKLPGAPGPGLPAPPSGTAAWSQPAAPAWGPLAPPSARPASSIAPGGGWQRPFDPFSALPEDEEGGAHP